MTPSSSSTPKALPLGKMIVFITIRVSAAICPRASPSQHQTGTRGNPALASCVWSTWWVTLGEQTRVICRECRRKLAPCPKGAASEPQPSRQQCSAGALSSYVRSVILAEERFFHFQLRQHTATTLLLRPYRPVLRAAQQTRADCRRGSPMPAPLLSL